MIATGRRIRWTAGAIESLIVWCPDDDSLGDDEKEQHTLSVPRKLTELLISCNISVVFDK